MDTASARMCTQIKSVMNQFEVEKTIERTNVALIHMAEEGKYPCVGKLAYGYIRNEDKTLSIDSEKAEVITRIFEMARKRYTLLEISMRVNDMQKEITFTSQTIRNILHKNMYSGTFIYKDKVYSNIVPPIITVEDQEEA